ncbi:MAG: OmpA family protein [Geminicoccaceae bacterium]
MAEADGCPSGVHDVLETVLIEGHTDDRPIRSGPYPDNWALSAARSRSTYRAMIAAAPGLDTLRNGGGAALLGVSGYEARRPVADGATDEARRVNRRIDVRFSAAAPMPRPGRPFGDARD